MRSIDGWLFEGEARLLFELARGAKPGGGIVEIGSWKGKSTVCLAKGSEAGPRLKVYAIDPHTGSSEHQAEGGRVWTFDEFKENIRRSGVDDLVVPILKGSTQAAADFDVPVSLLFIDGAHDFASVKADFEAWFPKLVDGGVVAFHDTTGWEGPRRVVRKALFRNQHIRLARFCWSVAYGQKVSEASFVERAGNWLRLIIKFCHDPILSFATRPAVKGALLRFVPSGE